MAPSPQEPSRNTRSSWIDPARRRWFRDAGREASIDRNHCGWGLRWPPERLELELRARVFALLPGSDAGAISACMREQPFLNRARETCRRLRVARQEHQWLEDLELHQEKRS